MSASYEIWLCDDYGRRLHFFEKLASFSYSRTTQGRGSLQMGIPFDDYAKAIPSLFKPDWRIDIWRSPMVGTPARREGSFLLRRYNVYQREGDNVRIMELYGVSAIELLKRQCWEQRTYLTDYLDDMMKTIVSGMFVTNPSATSTAPTIYDGVNYSYTGEFAVDEDASDGPVVTRSFYLNQVYDALNDLKKQSFTLNLISSANAKIYFDVIEDESISAVANGFGYRFRTYPNLRGRDRTAGIIYSPENGNLIAPAYSEDYGETITGIYLYNNDGFIASAQSDEQYLSRWNFVKFDQTTDRTVQANAQSDAYSLLKKSSSTKQMNATFLNSPGSTDQPRALYGLDWDLGDLLPVQFARKSMNCEVLIVYISVTELGEEHIIGKTLIG